MSYMSCWSKPVDSGIERAVGCKLFVLHLGVVLSPVNVKNGKAWHTSGREWCDTWNRFNRVSVYLASKDYLPPLIFISLLKSFFDKGMN